MSVLPPHVSPLKVVGGQPHPFIHPAPLPPPSPQVQPQQVTADDIGAAVVYLQCQAVQAVHTASEPAGGFPASASAGTGAQLLGAAGLKRPGAATAAAAVAGKGSFSGRIEWSTFLAVRRAENKDEEGFFRGGVMHCSGIRYPPVHYGS